MRCLAFAACLLGGCDLALGLTPRDPIDTDGDMVRDEADNCPETANLDQHDEDADMIGDLCDNCPHIANQSQDNTDEDGIGEACDDSPGLLDCIVRFDPFTSPTALLASKGTWVAQGSDFLAQISANVDNAYAIVDMVPHDNPLIVTRARVTILGNATAYNNVGVWGEATVAEPLAGVPEVGFLAEVGRTIMVMPADTSRAGLHVQKHENAAVTSNFQFVAFSPVQALTATSVVDLRLDMRGVTALRSSASIDGGAELVLSSTIGEIPAGRVALRSHNLAVAFEYVVIIERRTTLPCPGL